MNAKKSFKSTINNPAMQFISITEEEHEELMENNQPVTNEQPANNQPTTNKVVVDGYKNNPLYVETKSKRVQLLMKPSLYESIKELALKEGKSVNDEISTLLEKAIKGE